MKPYEAERIGFMNILFTWWLVIFAIGHSYFMTYIEIYVRKYIDTWKAI